MRTLQPAKLIDYLQQTSSVVIHQRRQRVAIKLEAWRCVFFYTYVLRMPIL